MSITRGQFLRSLGKSLPGLVASTGVATAAEAIFRRVAQAGPPEPKAAHPQTGEPVAFLHQVHITERVIALTFDDGPAPGITERILDALRTHDARATFFMIGEKVAAAPELARRVLAEGHELGHHTWTHPNLTRLPDAQVDEELDRPAAAFRDLLGGARATWFRPPYGALRQDQARRVRDRGMKVTMWSVDPQDWQARPGAEITRHIVEHVHPGAIILCHEMLPSAESLDATLTQLLEANYRFVTLSELNQLAAC